MQANRSIITRKREDFDGQLRIVIPHKILAGIAESDLLGQLYLYSIGFYPKAKYHYCERPEGAEQHILIYCTTGSGWLEMEGRKYFIQKGHGIFIPAGVSHKYGADEQEPWSVYWIHFLGGLGDQMIKLLQGEGARPYKAIPYSVERINLFMSIYTSLESGYSRDNINYINMCLWHYLSSFCYPNHFQPPVNKNSTDSIDKSIEFMRNNLHRKITLQMLAAEVNISPSRYLVLFKKKTGHSPLEYYNQIKIQKACQMLHFTDFQIKEISYELGISDPYYFSRLFSQVMGISPMEYRNRKR